MWKPINHIIDPNTCMWGEKPYLKWQLGRRKARREGHFRWEANKLNQLKSSSSNRDSSSAWVGVIYKYIWGNQETNNGDAEGSTGTRHNSVDVSMGEGHGTVVEGVGTLSGEARILNGISPTKKKKIPTRQMLLGGKGEKNEWLVHFSVSHWWWYTWLTCSWSADIGHKRPRYLVENVHVTW